MHCGVFSILSSDASHPIFPPLISTPGPFISISPRSSPTLSSLLVRLFRASSFPFLSLLVLLSSPPLLPSAWFCFVFTCTPHSFSSSPVLPPVLVGYSPTFPLAFSVLLCVSPFPTVITFSVQSVWLSCYHCSSSKFSWPNPFFLSLHLPLQHRLHVTLTSFFAQFNQPMFFFFSLSSLLTYPLLVAPMPYASICPITASLTLCLTLSSPPLCLPCLWPFALCTSNGWGVIHWLICWQPVWQGISFVSLPTMLPLSVCVSERESGKETERERESMSVGASVCIQNMFVKLCA